MGVGCYRCRCLVGQFEAALAAAARKAAYRGTDRNIAAVARAKELLAENRRWAGECSHMEVANG